MHSDDRIYSDHFIFKFDLRFLFRGCRKRGRELPHVAFQRQRLRAIQAHALADLFCRLTRGDAVADRFRDHTFQRIFCFFSDPVNLLSGVPLRHRLRFAGFRVETKPDVTLGGVG